MKRIMMMLITVAAVIIGSGCDTVTKYDKEGNITEKQVHSILKDDTVISASNVIGFEIEMSYSNQSGNWLPTARLLTGGTIFTKMNKSWERIIFASASSAGILNSMTSSTAESTAEVFVGAKGDTGAGAAAFMDALARYKMAKNGTSPATQTAIVKTITDDTGSVFERYAFVDVANSSYAWRSDGEPATIVYTASKTPVVGDHIYSDKELKTKTSTVKSKTAE